MAYLFAYFLLAFPSPHPSPNVLLEFVISCQKKKQSSAPLSSWQKKLDPHTPATYSRVLLSMIASWVLLQEGWRGNDLLSRSGIRPKTFLLRSQFWKSQEKLDAVHYKIKHCPPCFNNAAKVSRCSVVCVNCDSCLSKYKNTNKHRSIINMQFIEKISFDRSAPPFLIKVICFWT